MKKVILKYILAVVILTVLGTVAVCVYYYLKETKEVTYSNVGNNYSVTLDSKVKWKNNSKEINYDNTLLLDHEGGNSSIIVVRLPIDNKSTNSLQYFISSFDEESFSYFNSKNVKYEISPLNFSTENTRIENCDAKKVHLKDGDQNNYAYYIYLQTDEAFYSISISSSSEKLVDYFYDYGIVDKMEFKK